MRCRCIGEFYRSLLRSSSSFSISRFVSLLGRYLWGKADAGRRVQVRNRQRRRAGVGGRGAADSRGEEWEGGGECAERGEGDWERGEEEEGGGDDGSGGL